MQLALDTSTDTASLAIIEKDDILAELSWRCGQNHTTQLLPRLSYLLEKANLDLKTVDCIIVAKGPGSYNGLRVGLAAAKGLALSLDIPIIGVSTLEVEAYQHAATMLPVCPIFNAGRGEIATATYQKKANNRWYCLVPEHITNIDALCAKIKIKTLFCGEYLPAVAAQLKKQLKHDAIIATPAERLRRAGYLAELGLRRFKTSDFDDLTTLQPIYLRGPAITQAKHK